MSDDEGVEEFDFENEADAPATMEEEDFMRAAVPVQQTLVGHSRPKNILKKRTRLSTRLTPKVTAMTAFFNFGTPLDLPDLAAKIKIMDYTPNNFRSATVHLPRPKCTLRLTASGKCGIYGVKSDETAVYAAKKVCKLLHAVGVSRAKCLQFRVSNVTGSLDLKVPIRLSALHEAHSQWCSYEPEVFPALQFTILKPRCRVMVFVNGKMVFTGLRKATQLAEAASLLFPIAQPFFGAADGSSKMLIDKMLGADVGETEDVEDFDDNVDSEEELAGPTVAAVDLAKAKVKRERTPPKVIDLLADEDEEPSKRRKTEVDDDMLPDADALDFDLADSLDNVVKGEDLGFEMPKEEEDDDVKDENLVAKEEDFKFDFDTQPLPGAEAAPTQPFSTAGDWG